MRVFLQTQTWRLLLIALILAIDATLLGSDWLPLHGMADEASHALTAFIFLSAARRMGLRLRVVPGIAAAVLIDLDHVPDILGLFSPPDGTSRPVTHSLSLVALLVVLAVVNPKRRSLWNAAAVGLLSHLVRDLGTGAVLFWWPVSANPVSLPYLAYLAITIALAVVSTSVTVPARLSYPALARIRPERYVDRRSRQQ